MNSASQACLPSALAADSLLPFSTFLYLFVIYGGTGTCRKTVKVRGQWTGLLCPLPCGPWRSTQLVRFVFTCLCPLNHLIGPPQPLKKSFSKSIFSWAWWHIPVIPNEGGCRRRTFKASLRYITKTVKALCLIIKQSVFNTGLYDVVKR